MVFSLLHIPFTFAGVCGAVAPVWSKHSFYSACKRTPRGGYFEAGRAGCSVRQEFPVLLPLPPFPLGNSESESILPRGYNLTSPNIVTPQMTCFVTTASKLLPASAWGKLRCSRRSLNGKGNNQNKKRSLNNRNKTTTPKQPSQLSPNPCSRQGAAELITLTCHAQDETGTSKEETSVVFPFPSSLKLRAINRQLHRMFYLGSVFIPQTHWAKN